MLIYFYDIKIKGLQAYNTLKRRFYYQLKRSKLSTYPWRTKSVIIVEDSSEAAADEFFREFEGFIEVYKARTDAIEEVLTVEAPKKTGD
ncbi:hypothetical protein J4441_00445 [Candidatus Micrarchaeota archaeon]|nr:hypothetical protein [Candidatus Micrarchaeota archaeon]